MTTQQTGVCLVTANVPALCRFYAAVLDAEVGGDARHAFILVPGGPMTIFSEHAMEEMAPGSTKAMGMGRCILMFEVDDVESPRQNARSRCASRDAPNDSSVGQTLGMVPRSRREHRRSAPACPRT